MPIIAVSRGTFSGGQALAQCVAERLGYDCVGRDDLIEAATRYGISAQQLTSAMDKPPTFWERFTGEQRTAYIYCLRAALCERARGGSLVYHGHMGHLLLPGISHVISVRVIAELEYRIEAVLEQRDLTREEAISYIKKVDKERADWAQFLHGVHWDDPALYDMVLKLGKMRVESACELVARTAMLEEYQPTGESSRAMENLALGSQVLAELATNPRTLVTDLSVSADAGVVTIVGLVQRLELVDAVRQVAGAVAGVSEVRTEVRSVRVLPETE